MNENHVYDMIIVGGRTWRVYFSIIRSQSRI